MLTEIDFMQINGALQLHHETSFLPGTQNKMGMPIWNISRL